MCLISVSYQKFQMEMLTCACEKVYMSPNWNSQEFCSSDISMK